MYTMLNLIMVTHRRREQNTKNNHQFSIFLCQSPVPNLCSPATGESLQPRTEEASGGVRSWLAFITFPISCLIFWA